MKNIWDLGSYLRIFILSEFLLFSIFSSFFKPFRFISMLPGETEASGSKTKRV